MSVTRNIRWELEEIKIATAEAKIARARMRKALKARNLPNAVQWANVAAIKSRQLSIMFNHIATVVKRERRPKHRTPPNA